MLGKNWQTMSSRKDNTPNCPPRWRNLDQYKLFRKQCIYEELNAIKFADSCFRNGRIESGEASSVPVCTITLH